MNILGIHLTLLIGPKQVVPATPDLLQALNSVEVTLDSKDRSGFELNFSVGRSGPEDLFDYKLALNPLLKLEHRVIIMVKLDVVPEVLIDGIITTITTTPGSEPGSATITVTGDDLSGLFDLKPKNPPVEHLAMNDANIARLIILGYAPYGIIPDVIDPIFSEPTLPVERTPVQDTSDYQYLKELAQRNDHVFYIESGPLPNMSSAYWGPQKRLGIPQKALSVNMGSSTNVTQISFKSNTQSVTRVNGQVQDRTTNQVMPVQTVAATRVPLSSQPALMNQMQVRETRLPNSGLSTTQAMGRAQAETNKSTDQVVDVTGELDALRYDCLLKPRRLVDVRGVGYTNDGTYYVNKVTHRIKPGEYKQSFELTRDGVGALLPVVSNPVCI